MPDTQTTPESTLTLQDLSSLLPQQQSQQQTSSQPYPTISDDPTATQDISKGPPTPLIQGEQSTRPENFGLLVATPDDVKRADVYFKNGGDVNQLPVHDQLGLALAKNPDFFKQNPDAFYDYVYKPLQAQKGSLGQQFGQAVAGIPGMFEDFFKGLWGAAVNRGNKEADTAELWARKAFGMTNGQDYQNLVSRLATENATETEGLVRAFTTNEHLALSTASTLVQGTQPVAKMFAKDPASQDQIDRAYSQLLLNKGVAEQQLSDLGKLVQNTSANAYKAIGAASGQSDIAQYGAKLATAQPNEQAADALSQLWNPLNYLGVGEAAAAVGAVRPILFERGLEGVEDLTGATAKKTAMDTVQLLPANPELNAADPAYIPTRNLQSQLAPEARAAAQGVTDAQNVLNSRLTTLGRISGDPGTATTLMSNVLQGIGGGVQNLGELASKATNFGENFGKWISGGNESVAKAAQSAYEKVVFGVLLKHLGPLGGAIETGLEHLPDIGNAVGSLAKTAGQELTYADNTIPYATRVAMQNKYMPKGLASFIDSPLVQTAVNIGKGGLTTAATGAAIGGLSGGIPGAVGGFVQGGVLGMAGGLGQWISYRNPNQYLLQMRSNWKRYNDLLAPAEAQQFRQLSPTNQLMLGNYAHNFPGLRVDYSSDPSGPRGSHYVDQGGASHIQVNIANPDSVIRGIMAHELTHGATHSGMITDLYDTLLGNPVTGEIGQYTALGADGKPVGTDPITQRYQTNQEFQNLKGQYVNALAQSGIPTAHLGDFDIAREIYAEHGADYLLSGGPMLDSNSAFRPGLFSTSALKTAMAKTGFPFDGRGQDIVGTPDGNVSGTGVFSDLQRNPTLQNLAQTFYTKKWHDGLIASEEQPTHQFTKRDLQNPNTTETWLNNAPEIVRNPDGTAKRDPNTGLPIMRTPKEVKQYNATFADALRKGLDSLPEDQRMDMGYRKSTSQEGDNVFARYLPDNVLDSLAATNQYNPHQIASLRLLSRVLADKGNPGMEMRMFYRTATTPSKRYGTFAGSERLAVPYGLEITHDNNVNIKSVDFNQLDNNYLKVRNREPYKSLWNDASEFTQDAHSYFTNHKEGRPGADAIGEQKRDAINALAGFDTQTHRESNPLVDRMPNSVRPIVKSFGIDRANQISSTGFVRPFVSEDQYYKANRNYLPGAPEVSFLPRKAAGAAPAEAAPPDKTAIPVSYHQTKSGETTDKIPYGITSAPLVSDKQPTGPLSENNFGHVDYLSGKGQKTLTALDKNSAVTTYADRLVDDFQRIKDNPDIMAGKTWYKQVRGLLKKGFGKDDTLFAHLLAATSAGNGVTNNWNDALQAYHRYQSGAFDDAIREYKRTGVITEDMKPTKADGKKFYTNSDEVLKVLAGTWLDEVQGPKTPNFFANLFGRGKEATIDKWAARTMRRLGNEGVEGAPEQWRLQPKSEQGVSDLDFAFSQQVFRQAAEKVGVDPHELQAVMWFAEKDLWDKNGWSPKGSAAAEKSSYIPQLKAYAEHVSKTPSFKEVSPEDFIAARSGTTRPEFLSDLKPGDLTQHKLFTNRDGTVGAAVDPNGDLQNVFNNSGVQGAGGHAIVHAINNLGARTLDAFDGHLPHRYAQFGFQETGRAKFDPAQAPANWDPKDGKPDVVFMRWNGYPAVRTGSGQEGALRRAWDKTGKSWIPVTKAQ